MKTPEFVSRDMSIETAQSREAFTRVPQQYRNTLTLINSYMTMSYLSGKTFEIILDSLYDLYPGTTEALDALKQEL